MKKLSNLVAIAALVATTVLVGCKKEKVVVSPGSTVQQIAPQPLAGVPNCNATVNNGHLSFATQADVQAYHTYLETHSNTEINELEERNNFISLIRKMQIILNEYEALNEKRETTMQEILAFRELHKDYVTITDDDFYPNIKGFSNRLISPNGYVQVGGRLSKYVGQDIYTTNVDNAALLALGSYTNSLVHHSQVKVVKMKKNTRQLNQWENFYRYDISKCSRWHSTQLDIEFYALTDYDWVSGNATASCGFNYFLKNKKRGWTGIWYAHTRPSSNQGYYGAAYSTIVNYNDVANSNFVYKSYCGNTWTANFSNGTAAQQWANGVLGNTWAFMTGTVTYNVCGTKTWTY